MVSWMTDWPTRLTFTARLSMRAPCCINRLIRLHARKGDQLLQARGFEPHELREVFGRSRCGLRPLAREPFGSVRLTHDLHDGRIQLRDDRLRSLRRREQPEPR